MANTGVITIRLEESGKTPGPKKIDPSKPTQEAEKATALDALDTAVLSIMIRKTAKQFLNISVGEVKYQINRYFNLTDNYIAKQNMDIALNVINKVWDIGASIYTGAKVGSAAGPVGAIIGAVLSAGVSFVSTGLQINHNYEQQQINLNKMDVQLQFNRQRAGYSLTAGSIGENR